MAPVPAPAWAGMYRTSVKANLKLFLKKKLSCTFSFSTDMKEVKNVTVECHSLSDINMAYLKNEGNVQHELFLKDISSLAARSCMSMKHRI